MKNVAIEKSEDVLVLERFQALGVARLHEWDALVFLYGHASSLVTAAQIARLIGCDQGEIGAALRRLEALGLLQRSRDSQGVRLHQFSVPPEPARYACLLELMTLAQTRTGRLLLLKHLQRPHPRAGMNGRDGGLRLA